MEGEDGGCIYKGVWMFALLGIIDEGGNFSFSSTFCQKVGLCISMDGLKCTLWKNFRHRGPFHMHMCSEFVHEILRSMCGSLNPR